VSEKLYNAVWGIGCRLLNMAQRAGLLGSSRSRFRRLGHILIPAPKMETSVTLLPGMKMVAPPGMRGARSYAAGVYEQDVTGLFKALVLEGMTVVDLGASLGYYALLASSLVGASGRVYAFEPEPESHSYLLRNIDLNDCCNVRVVEKAVSDKGGDQTFILSSRRSVGPIGGFLSSDSRTCGSVVVQTTSLDDFFEKQGWPGIDLIKVDIDGSEGWALHGMREVSSRNPQMQLIMEFDPDRIRQSDNRPEILAATIQDLGFHSGYIIERRLKSFRIAQGFPETKAHYNVLFKKD